MKKIFLFLVIIVLLASCKNNSLNNGFTIKGIADNSLNNKKVLLKFQDQHTIKAIDSTIIKDGKFEFKGITNKPQVYGIFIEDTRGAIGLFIENSPIEISIDTKDISRSKITGSKTQDDFMNFYKKSSQITSKMNILFPEFQKARAENNVEKLKDINAKMQKINEESTLFALDYAKKNPNSYIAAYALNSTLSTPSVNKDTIQLIYNNFSDYVKEGDFAKQTAKFLESAEINFIKQKDSIQN